ncbi:60S acidic ribosomal protein P1 isoform X2 [Tupaia chinensis]|uniref:60S acidic ribosomal protein P1 isoform X2 n=1 Tax=Tupaia chinensis TaxID=246437 RepID=UPI0003C8EC97|nr:60S acidic ribosomal protein P1 isoform X2 [Tupaia chinensis]
MASVSKLTCIYSAFILHDDEDKINALANVNIGSLICSIGADEPAPAAGAAPARGPAPTAAAAPAEEKKVGAQKEKSEESNDDIGFDLFD